MEEHVSLFLQLPSEILVDLLATTADTKSVLQFYATSSAHQKLFDQQNGLWQLLTQKLHHWSAADAKQVSSTFNPLNAVTNWKKEYCIASFFDSKIRSAELTHNNFKLEPSLLETLAKNHFRVEGCSSEEFGIDYTYCAPQAPEPLYPLPIGNFTVAYYEVEFLKFGEVDFVVGAAQDGYASYVGLGRNSYSFASDATSGIFYLSSEFVSEESQSKPLYLLHIGDIIGFGINFSNRSIFWTKNGEVLYETNVDAVQNPISNIKSLHATVSIANHEFKANFGEKPFVFDILAYQKKNASETDLRLYYETIQSHLCSFMDSESFERKFFEDQSLFPLASDCNPPKSPVEISHFGYMLTYCRNHPESTVSLSDDFYIQLQTCRAMCHSAKRLLESEPTKSTQRYLQTLATMFEQQNYEEKSWQEKVITIYNLASNHVTNLVGQLLHHTIDSTAQYAFRYESWAIKAICLHQIVFSDTPDGHFINQAAVNLLQHQTQDSELTEEVLLQFLFDMIFSTFQLRAGVMEVVANQRCAEIIKQKSQEYEQLSKIYGEDFLFKTNYSLMFKELEDRAKEERNLTDVEKRLDPIYLLPSFLRRYNTPMGQVAVDFLVLCGVYKYQIAPEQFSTKEEFLEEVKRRICDSITPELLDEYLQYCKDRAKNNPDDKSFEKEVASLPFLGVDLSQGRNIDEIRKVVLKLDKPLKKPMHGTENQTTAGSKFSVRVSVGIMAGLAIGIGLGLFFLRKKVK